MAVERAKLEAVLDEKLKGKSLTKNFKSEIAAKYCDKIENDEAIDTWLDDRLDILLATSSEADRRATEAATKAKADQKKDEGTQQQSDTSNKPDAPTTESKKEDEMPAWAKALVDKVSSFEQQRKTETITERFKKDERLKGVPEFMLNRAIPKSEDEYEASVTALATDYTEFAKQNKLAAFGNDAPPAGTGTPNGKTASKAEIEAVGLIN